MTVEGANIASNFLANMFGASTGMPVYISSLRNSDALHEGSEKKVATRNFEASVPSGSSFDGAVAAFDSGLQSVLPQMVDWTLTQGSQHQ